MPRPDNPWPSYVRRAGVLALSGGLASAAIAENLMHWRLGAHIPVICTILGVSELADRPTGLEITTTCNAERYEIVLHHSTATPVLRAARSSAGPVRFTGSTVAITSTRPGYALTTIELVAPVSRGRLSITLQPI